MAEFTLKDLDASLRRVQDFPKSGVCFYDITSLLAEPTAFRFSLEELAKQVKASKAQALCAIEARGFVFAAPLAQALALPLVLARKPGKLPNPVSSSSYDLEYGSDKICIQNCDLEAGRSFFLIDDLIATGGTLSAAADLLEKTNNTICGIGAVIGLPFLGYKERLKKFPIHTLINYDSE